MWESLCSAIVSAIEQEYEKIINTEKEVSEIPSHPISIDSYVIEDKIGDVSTCAAVYRALRDDEPVALKAMFNFSCEDVEDMMRFDNFGAELVTKSLPPHPNVIKITAHMVSSNVPHSLSARSEYPAVFEYGKDDTLYLEMPLYSCSLRQYLSSVRLSESQVWWVLYQVVSAVHHIHSHRVVHRDIKLDNLLVKLEGDCLRVVLTDFGMAHDCLRSSGPLNRKWGNPMLMPPEIALLKNDGPVDYTKADIWCVGSLVYELLGRENPFSQPRLRSDRYDPRELPALPSDNPVLCDLVSRLLSRDPALRPSPLQCLLTMGTLLWLPQLFETENLTQQETARQLAQLSWETFRASKKQNCEPELVGLMYFLKFATGAGVQRVASNFVL
ncbi:hypothetical protein ACHWQZ_G004397 [Mnemiopsis leidyi]